MNNSGPTPFPIRLSALIAPAVIVCLFGSVLLGLDRLAFRDVSHFYTPLYEYLGGRAADSWLPLWNPLDQTGMPLLGETTTAFFYPPRYLLFALPLASETALGWYVALHLMLASSAAAWVARGAGCSPPASVLAGLTYSLSGAVLFLYCNPPFLVGAAWLPLALGPLISIERMVNRPGADRVQGSRDQGSRCQGPNCQGSNCQGLGRVLLPAVAFSMMVLGGDPQTALHAGIVAVVVAGCRAIRRSAAPAPGRGRAMLLIPLVASVLTAPQLAASIDWGRRSERFTAEGVPGWWQPPAPGSHRAQAFQFSVPPWHLAELATPNAFGRPFPEFRRLSSLIPGDGRVWTPTLYLGMLPLLAMSCRLWRIRREGIDCWLGIAIAALLCSFGSFGLAWWWQAITGTLGQLDGALGGPYWLLHHGLPGYAAFRYPAKWLPLFSFGVAMVTAGWFDQLGSTAITLARRVAAAWLLVIAVVLVAGLALCLVPDAFGRLVANDRNALPVDRFWGPLQLTGGLHDVVKSLAHSVVVLVLLGIPLVLRFDRRPQAAWQWAVVIIVAVDLFAAGSMIVARVPRHVERDLVASISEAADGDRPLAPLPGAAAAERWLRTQTGGGWPQVWRRSPSETRLADVEASQRGAWFGRWHLSAHQGVFNNMTTLRSREIDRFWEAARTVTSDLNENERNRFWRSVRAWLAIDGVTHSSAQVHNIPRDGKQRQLVHVDRHVDPGTNQRLRLTESWRVVSEDPAGLNDWIELLEQVVQRGSRTTPLVIEAPRSVAVPAIGDRALPADGEQGTIAVEPADSIRIEQEEPERVEIAIRSSRGGLLRRPVFQDGWWQAELQAVDGGRRMTVPVHTVDFIAQGVIVPPGDWTITLRYRPAWLWPTLVIALVGWCTVIGCSLFVARSRWGERRTGRTPA